MDGLNIEVLRGYIQSFSYVISEHAKERMREKNIALSDIITSINSGEIIERYQDRKPYPACLVLGWINDKPLHVVLSDQRNTSTIIIITAYWPDENLWSSDFKTRL